MTNFNFLSKFEDWLGELSSRMSLVGVSYEVGGARVAREWLKYVAAVMLVLTIRVGNAWGADTYTKITSTASLSNGDVVIIAMGSASPTTGVTGGTVQNSTSTKKDATVSTTASEWMKFTVTTTTDGWYLKNSSNQYVGKPTDNTFYLTTGGETYNGVCSVNSNGVLCCNSRYLQKNSSNYRMYNLNDKYSKFYVWKVTGGCTSISPSLTYSTDSIGIGGTATVASLNTDGSTGSVTYSVSPASGVATINASTGVLTGTGTGNVTVTATIAAAGGKCEGTATATIKVRRGITYYVGATSYTVGGIDGNTLVSTLPASPSSCDDTNYPYFYGWKNGSISGISSSAPTILSSELVSSSTAANTYYAVFTNVANLTFGFESGEDETGWTNVITGMSNLGSYVTAHGGARAASVSGSTTTIIQTANKIIPSAFSAWITKESNNTDTPSEWKLQKSTDGSSWTDVASWSATSPTRGTWNKITLSAAQIASITVESYIRIILHTTISAYRDMDDVSISYGTGDPEYITTCCTKLGTINGSVNLSHFLHLVIISVFQRSIHVLLSARENTI